MKVPGEEHQSMASLKTHPEIPYAQNNYNRSHEGEQALDWKFLWKNCSKWRRNHSAEYQAEYHLPVSADVKEQRKCKRAGQRHEKFCEVDRSDCIQWITSPRYK